MHLHTWLPPPPRPTKRKPLQLLLLHDAPWTRSCANMDPAVLGWSMCVSWDAEQNRHDSLVYLGIGQRMQEHTGACQVCAIPSGLTRSSWDLMG